ncbi:hypothetical protein DIC66_07115 [Rhodoferax lacus]|uniref:Uncharacterized protein n=1 Tax=Rhodoferax lacus TaxID=2184758 RepID=A0A3E1RE32_9BURK|nr:hypothetical protein [Rhodoferax lacus]RFO97625.1 hypothetical protein DIC66_07115 [Rhodoferax lacus]
MKSKLARFHGQVLVLVLATWLLPGCQVGQAQPAQAAVLIDPDAAVRLELRQAVLTLSGFASVTLADSDLTRSSELVLERRHQYTASGDLLQGRDLEQPQRLHLQIQDGQCWLLHQSSGKRQLLKQAHCRALSALATPPTQ